MTAQPGRDAGDETSLLTLGTTLLRSRGRIMRWMVLGAALAAVPASTRPLLYSASASFVPRGNDAGRSELATLAGQFGIAVPTGNQSESPDFYLRVLRSRVLLEQVARDTFVVQELNGQRLSFQDLFKIPAGPPQRRDEQSVDLLVRLVKTSAVKTTGVVELSVATRWPSVSLAIATSVLEGVNDFNQRTRRGQASAERRFIEGRLALAGTELRAAEDRLEGFLRTNRELSSSPQLIFQRDRLQRDLILKQQVFTSLTQASEDVRIREVRDTPVITVIEPAAVSSLPEPRRRVIITLLGLVVGGIVGTGVAIASAVMARLREDGNAAAGEFSRTLGEVRSGMLGPVRRLRERMRSKE